MLEEYYRLKMKYKEYILLIKVGNFYEILDKDAMIIHQILRYQLTRLSDTVKCGFPITNLEKVLTTLDTKEMNYVVIENKNIVRERSFENNIYSSFQFDTNVFKYFYHLDHEMIKQLVRKKIKDKEVLRIIDVIIDSTDETYVNEEIMKLKEIERKRILKNSSIRDREEMLKKLEKVPLYDKGKGVCIGNMVSQIVATFYLDEMDQYIEKKLGIKAYGRYMDDFYCMSENKEYLKACLDKIGVFLKKYKLELNQKTKIYSSTENFEFLGFVFSSKNHDIRMKLTNKTKKNFKGKIRLKKKELLMRKIHFLDYVQVRNSYRGHLSYGNCKRLYHKYTIEGGC